MRSYIISVIIMFACSISFAQGTKEIKMLKEKISKFVPVELKYDPTLLDAREKLVLDKLYLASKIMDEIFRQQVYDKNDEILSKLKKSKSEFDKLALEYFNIMSGPFDRLDHDKPFWGKNKKPLGANFYPPDMTKSEFNNWIKKHPGDKNDFTSEMTVIRKDKKGLKAIPFSIFYRDKLEKASELLTEAAGYCDNPSLKKYLELRAKAFITNDYYESDMAWMDIKDSKIEVVIGPYEVYEDNLFNYKASFESFVTLVDPIESQKLNKFGSYLSDIEEHLPIDKQYKNTSRGLESPIVVVNEVFSGGDTKAGVQTLAFNLPNDERVRQAKGSKKVMLKNVHEAKFEKLLLPIADIVLDKDQRKFVTFESFFDHSLMHEMSHGVGPGFITVNGLKTEVKKELKETYSKLEECKADILGMYNNLFMIDKGVYKKDFDKEIYITFLAGVFRSVRFGINEAHGGGTAIIYNYLLEKGGYEYNNSTETVRVNFDKIYPALKDLANKILMIQAAGDYEGAKRLIASYAVFSPSMEKLRNKLSALPVDIKPVFQIEEN
jgi:hypothetical protein